MQLWGVQHCMRRASHPRKGGFFTMHATVAPQPSFYLHPIRNSFCPQVHPSARPFIDPSIDSSVHSHRQLPGSVLPLGRSTAAGAAAADCGIPRVWRELGAGPCQLAPFPSSGRSGQEGVPAQRRGTSGLTLGWLQPHLVIVMPADAGVVQRSAAAVL